MNRKLPSARLKIHNGSETAYKSTNIKVAEKIEKQQCVGDIFKHVLELDFSFIVLINIWKVVNVCLYM